MKDTKMNVVSMYEHGARLSNIVCIANPRAVLRVLEMISRFHEERKTPMPLHLLLQKERLEIEFKLKKRISMAERAPLVERKAAIKRQMFALVYGG